MSRIGMFARSVQTVGELGVRMLLGRLARSRGGRLGAAQLLQWHALLGREWVATSTECDEPDLTGGGQRPAMQATVQDSP